jgi:hypothetical protein
VEPPTNTRTLAALHLRSLRELDSVAAHESKASSRLKRCGASLPDLRELSKRHRPGLTDIAPLHRLLGQDRARNLDVLYGSVQPPLAAPEKPNRKPIKPWERHPNGKVITHPRRITVADPHGMLHPNLLQDPKLEALLCEGKKYVWSVAAMGTLFLGEEIRLEGLTCKGKPKHLGHISLTDGRPARICGELSLNKLKQKFNLNPLSGRFSRYLDRKPDDQLPNVAKLFEELGLPIDINFSQKSSFKPYALVMPSLAPSEIQKANPSQSEQNPSSAT